jgi:hypothetical protein
MIFSLINEWKYGTIERCKKFFVFLSNFFSIQERPFETGEHFFYYYSHLNPYFIGSKREKVRVNNLS